MDLLQELNHIKKNIFQILGLPERSILNELDQKLNRLERDIDRYKAKLRSSRLKHSYEEILKAINDKMPVEKTTKVSPAKKVKTNLDKMMTDALSSLKGQLNETEHTEHVDEEDHETILKNVIQTESNDSKPLLVLVDSELSAADFSEISANFKVSSFTSLNQALGLIESKKPSYVLFERAMLSQDSVKLKLEQLQLTKPEIKWIALNSYLSGLMVQNNPSNLSFNAELQKPFDASTLLSVLQD